MGFFNFKSGYANSVKWGSYALAVSFVRQIALVYIFMQAIGKEGYAFWLVISAMALMIRALNLGQLHYTSNVINLNYHIDQDVGKVIKAGQGANIIYMSVQLLLAIIISFPAVFSFFTNFSQTYLIAVKVQYSFVVLVLARIILQYTNLFLLRMLEPVGKVNLTVKYQSVAEFLDFVIIAAAVYFTHSIFYTCLSLLIFALMFFVYVYMYVRSKVPFEFFKGVDFKEALNNIKASSTLTFSFIVEKIYEVGLNVIVAFAYAASILPQFATSRIMSNSFYRVCDVLVTPLLPEIQKEFSLKNENFIFEKMITYWRFTGA